MFHEDHGAQPVNVAGLEKEDAFRGAPVPSRPARLLVEVLHRLGEGVVEDEADVGFVDAHPEGDGGYNNLATSGQPFPMDLRPGASFQRRMVRQSSDPSASKTLRQGLGVFDAQCVDDSTLVSELRLDEVG